jgi:hypothetical protein
VKRLTRSRTAFFSVGIVTSLALAGVLYAHWTDTLEVDGNVQTGEIGAGWFDVSCREPSVEGFQVLPGPGGGDLTARPFGLSGDTAWVDQGSPFSLKGTRYTKWETNKNVAHLILDWTALEPVATLTYFHTYPSYYDDCEMEFTNTGSIPIAVPYLVIEGPAGASLATDIFTDDGAIWVEWSGETPPEPQIDPFPPFSVATGSLKLHVEQSALQNARYSFTIAVCYHNWNEPTRAEDDICDLYDVDGATPVSKTTREPVIVVPDPF